MTITSKQLIDQYINALLIGDNVTLNKIGNIRSKLSAEDKPYFRQQYLSNIDKIEARFLKEDKEAQQLHENIIKEFTVLSELSKITFV